MGAGTATYQAPGLQEAQLAAAHLPLKYGGDPTANLKLLKLRQVCSPAPLPAAALGRAMDTDVWLAAWMGTSLPCCVLALPDGSVRGLPLWSTWTQKHAELSG